MISSQDPQLNCIYKDSFSNKVLGRHMFLEATIQPTIRNKAGLKFKNVCNSNEVAIWINTTRIDVCSSITFFLSFLAVLGPHCCTWAFSICSKWGHFSNWNVKASCCTGFFLFWDTGSRGLPRWHSGRDRLPANAGDTGDTGWFLGQEEALEEEMATHSSILSWEIPWTEEPSRLQSIELQSQTQLNDWAQMHQF